MGGAAELGLCETCGEEEVAIIDEVTEVGA